ncbi:MAG TPA: hypothetical protein VF092_28590 [Longimicrobium sp.]
MKFRTLLALPLALAPLALAGCSDSTGSAAGGQVQIRFGVAQSGANASLAAAGPRFAAGDPLVITGTNGTLTVTDIKLVVSRFQLRGADGSSCGATTSASDDRNGGDDDGPDHESGECEFNAGPQFVTLPLDGSQLTVTTGTVPPGTYTSVRFRVKNLDFDDDDDHDDDDNAAAQQALLATIRQQIADWPAKASMLVTGTFTPAGGTARNFRAFLRAEVRLTLPINPPLTVAEGTNTAQVAVLLDPAAIFRAGTTVVDLSQFNGRVAEFDAEHGFESEGRHGPG